MATCGCIEWFCRRAEPGRGRQRYVILLPIRRDAHTSRRIGIKSCSTRRRRPTRRTTHGQEIVVIESEPLSLWTGWDKPSIVNRMEHQGGCHCGNLRTPGAADQPASRNATPFMCLLVLPVTRNPNGVRPVRTGRPMGVRLVFGRKIPLRFAHRGLYLMPQMRCLHRPCL